MKAFHLPPNNPWIRHMTLLQRDFVITNLNADIAEAEGKKVSSHSDASASEWLRESDSKFSAIPKGMSKKDFKYGYISAFGLSRYRTNKRNAYYFVKQSKHRQNYRIKHAQKNGREAWQLLQSKIKAKHKRQSRDNHKFHGIDL